MRATSAERLRSILWPVMGAAWGLCGCTLPACCSMQARGGRVVIGSEGLASAGTHTREECTVAEQDVVEVLIELVAAARIPIA